MMRPSQKVGRALQKSFLCILLTAIAVGYVCAWFINPVGIGVFTLVIGGIYIAICVDSIKTYYNFPFDENLPTRNILWPIVKWLDRNYKEENEAEKS